MTFNKKLIKEVCNDIIANDEKELFARTKKQLEDYWYFNFDKMEGKLHIIYYEFFQMLELYNHYCRRWEEHHNGSICVVERVRDQYLLPKIKKFINRIKTKTH